MGFFRLVGIVLFVLAALAGFGWGLACSTHTIAGLIAAGLACYAWSGVTLPLPPSSL